MDSVELLDKMPDQSGCKCIPAWLRYLLFAITFILGFTLCSASLGKCSDKTSFYLMFVIGVFAAWFASLFIKSIKLQIKHMTKTTDNIICNITIPICLIVTCVLEAVSPHWYSVIAPYIICFAALIWYSLSLIPGFQQCMKGCFKKCMPCL
ncbi:Vesicle_transport protein [Hexamita inflata]|uniref:Vesicle transport protein n=1 Tax=Hexamita inflata TaxID=28002 RepID=A0AA86RSB5_9EUKA|nr:Vesicle transport protein [Hexamita inflata]CAI9977117.1 Vesicle transport protein [Hexamita inflata]